MIPESKFNRLTQTDILKLHVHYDTSIQGINVSENDDWIYVQGTLNSGIYPDLRSSNDTAIELNQSCIEIKFHNLNMGLPGALSLIKKC